jgi:chromosome segregation ATPase
MERAMQNPNSGVILDDWLDKKVESVEAELDSKRNTLEFLAGKLQTQASRLAKLDPNLDVVEFLKGPNQMLTTLQDRLDADTDEITALLRQIDEIRGEMAQP